LPLNTRRSTKRLTGFLKLFFLNISNFFSDIANVMIQRAYDALLYNHFCWKDGKHSWVHFEELALVIFEHMYLQFKLIIF